MHVNIKNSIGEDTTTNRHGVGVIAGVNRGTVRYVYALGRVNTIERNAGGLVGFNTGDIIASYADVDVTGKGSVGGLVGTNDGNIIASYAQGDVFFSEANGGGLVGEQGQ